MKYRLISIALVMSLCASQVSNATPLALFNNIALFHGWLPNIDTEVLVAAVATLSARPDNEHLSIDDIFDGVLLQSSLDNDANEIKTEVVLERSVDKDGNTVEKEVTVLTINPNGQNKRCYFFPRVECLNGENCVHIHDQSYDRETVVMMRKQRKKAIKKEKQRLAIEWKQQESDANFGIVVTENGQRIDSNSRNFCKKKRTPRPQQRPPVINQSPVTVSYWASVPRPHGQWFDIFYSFQPSKGTCLISYDPQFWDFILSIAPNHILGNNIRSYSYPSWTVVEISGPLAGYFIGRYT